MQSIQYVLATAGLAAIAMTAAATGTHNKAAPLLARHLSQRSKQVGPNLYELGEAGNVLLAEGCAYHVQTRLNLSAINKGINEQQAVPGAIALAREADGSPVCSKHLKDRSALVYGESRRLYRLRHHPFVVFVKPDGCEMVAPGHFDPHTERWSTGNPAKAIPLMKDDGQPSCRAPWQMKELERGEAGLEQ